MDLRFELGERPRALLRAYEALEYLRVPEAMLQYSEMFGSTFAALAGIRRYLEKRHVPYGTLFREIVAGSCDAELAALLDGLDTAADDTGFLGQVRDRLTADFAKYDGAIASSIKDVYGFGMPKSATIVLGRRGSHTAAFMMDSAGDDVLIAFATGSDEEPGAWISILTHEILHGLMRSAGVFMNNRKASEVEELLLEYSVPKGFLAERMGMADKADLQYAYENSLRRNYSKEISRQVRATVEEYISNVDRSMIWRGVMKAFPDCVDADAIARLG